MPLVKAISSTDKEGNTYITVINNSKDDVTNINLALDGRDLTGKEIQVWYLTSDSVLDENTQADPDKVTVQKTNVSATEETMKYTLAPHSITAFSTANRKLYGKREGRSRRKSQRRRNCRKRKRNDSNRDRR